VKVVEGSDIYNFPIDRIVHFYLTFWSYTCSNRGTGKQFGLPHRAATSRARAPRPRPVALPPEAAHPEAPRPEGPRAPCRLAPRRGTSCLRRPGRAGARLRSWSPAAYKSPGSASRVRATSTSPWPTAGRPAAPVRAARRCQ
jgi:hypothetical protein